MTTQENEKTNATPAVKETAIPETFVSPEANIFEDKDGYILETEMPGVNKTGLEILVEGNILTVTGRRAKWESSAEPVYRESSDSDYRRAFELDPAIDTNKIDARIEQGVLTVRLPKSERAKSRKVQISD